MTKLQIYDSSGNKKSQIETEIFSYPIREDIVQKIAEIERLEEKHPSEPYMWAGMQTSASGNVKHNRHVWKTDRGRGMGRFPKKRMSDKGSHFVWVGAVVPGTRGGRRAHPPRALRANWKINKKEMILGLKSALAMVGSTSKVKEKYASLNEKIKIELPFILDSKVLDLKTKEFLISLRKILGEDLIQIALQEKKNRAGIGKMRGRRYKKNAGLLLVLGNNQEKKMAGIEIVNTKALRINDLASNGARLVMFTEEAIRDLENKIHGKKKNKQEIKTGEKK